MKGLVYIRERQNSYGLLVAVLLIIIMVLISYIAYSKGLEKSKEKNTTTTTTTKLSEQKINKLYNYDEVCGEEKECNKELFNSKDLIIKLESVKEGDLVVHNLKFSGKTDKTINLKRFVSLQIIDSTFYLIEETLNDETEVNTLTLYDKDLSRLDKIEINNLIKKSINGLEITFYTFDESCEGEDSKNFIKNSALISSDGFNLVGTSKGPLKEEGFTC